MATIDRTRIDKPSQIVEDDQGQLRARQGISREVVSELSKIKGEPDWMAEKRIKSLEIFERKPIPTWGPDLGGLNLDDLVLYSPPTAGRFNSWDDVPEEMKQTYEDLGIPQAEREHLAGVVGVWRQEPVYEGLKEEYAKQGILFCSMDTAITEYPELVQKYFMTKCVPAQDNKFSALHGAVWSGGAFCYIPKGVKCDLPLQSYFRMEGAGEGTFEHTLIVADEGAEGTTSRAAPRRPTASTRCTRRSSRSSCTRAQRRATRPYRTGRRTYTTSTPSVQWSMRTGRSSGSVGRWARST